MREKETLERAAKDKAQGKSPSTQAGEFVREEIEHIREGKHGARSTKQAIAIGLSKARRAGVDLPPPETGSRETREQATRDVRKGHTARGARKSAKRSRAVSSALKREGHSAARSRLSHVTRVLRRRSVPQPHDRAPRKKLRQRGRSDVNIVRSRSSNAIRRLC